MNDRKIFLAAVAGALLVMTAGCAMQEEGPGTGTFQLLVSDQQSAIDDFDSLVASFDRARVFGTVTNGSAGNTTDDVSPGYSEFGLNASVDLTTVKGINATRVLDTSLEEGNYAKVKLYVSSVNGTVGGESVGVKVPSDKLMVTKNFGVEAGSVTRFVFDIDVVERGTGGYNLLPVVSESGVAGEDVEVREVG